MNRDHAHATVFGRGSNVLEYWLAHGEGFRVASTLGARNRVDHVIVDPAEGRATALVVRSSGGRKRPLPAAAFSGVDPIGRVLYVDRNRATAAIPFARHAAADLSGVAARRLPVWRDHGARAVRTSAATARNVVAEVSTATAARLPGWRSNGERAVRRGATITALAARHLYVGTHAALEWLWPRVRMAAEQALVVSAAMTVAAAEALQRLAVAAAEARATRRRESRTSGTATDDGN